MASARPIHEVFDEMLYAVLDVTRYAGIWRIHPDSFRNGYRVEQIEHGGTLTLRYHDKNDWHSVIEFNNIVQSGLSKLTWGDPVYGNMVDLGTLEEEVDNREGVNDFPINFRDLFSQSESSSSTDSTSATQSLTVKAAVSIEGVGSLETEAMASATEAFEESEGKDSTEEEESSAGTVVPGKTYNEDGSVETMGRRVRVTETRKKGDSTRRGEGMAGFNFGIALGKTTSPHDHWAHGGWEHWPTFDRFLDCVKGRAPDNWALAQWWKHHPPAKRDMERVMRPLNAEVSFDAVRPGSVIRSIVVEEF